MRALFVITPAVLFLHAFRCFYLGGCALNASITPYLAFQACFIYLLYILPRLRKNVFKSILQCSVRIGFGSGVSSTSAVVPVPLPGYPRRAVLFGSGFVRSCRAAGFHRFPGWSRDGARTPRKCTTNQKQHQNRDGLSWENLKKIAEI